MVIFEDVNRDMGILNFDIKKLKREKGKNRGKEGGREKRVRYRHLTSRPVQFYLTTPHFACQLQEGSGTSSFSLMHLPLVENSNFLFLKSFYLIKKRFPK